MVQKIVVEGMMDANNSTRQADEKSITQTAMPSCGTPINKELIDLAEDCDKQFFVQRIRSLMTRMYHKLAQGIIKYKERQKLPDLHCPTCVIALYFMAIRTFVDDNKELDADKESVTEYFQNAYMIDASNIHWVPENPAQTEKDLWKLAVMREIGEYFSLSSNEAGLPDCIRDLEQRKSYVLCLILWLFPQFATADRIKIVEIMASGNRAWLWRDKMLFWLACMRDSNYSREKARNIETQIRGLQLENGGFATVEGEDANADLISSSMGLLVLVCCARNDLKGSMINAVQKTVHWIVDCLTVAQDANEPLDCAWALYALSEYLTLFR